MGDEIVARIEREHEHGKDFKITDISGASAFLDLNGLPNHGLADERVDRLFRAAGLDYGEWVAPSNPKLDRFVASARADLSWRTTAE